MRSVQSFGADVAPPIIIQTASVQRRISASDAVATLVAELAFGPARRSDFGTLAAVTAARIADAAGVR